MIAQVALPSLHPGQLAVASNPARFKVLACGRRWGKTRLGSLLCFAAGLEGKRAWWVAPSYPVAQIGWQAIKGLARQIPGTMVRLADKMVVLPSGGNIQVRSADRPDSLRGVGLDFVVIDEAAFVAEAAWQEGLRPALSDRVGGALIISTPKGRNWFWRYYQRGLQQEAGEWASFRFPSISNPYLWPEEIEKAQAELPAAIFEQEYLAEFLENEGAVFRNIDACLNAPLDATPEQHVGHRIRMGADWGKHNDFTALSVGCATCHVELALDRFNQIDYAFQRGRLAALADRWHVTHIEAESNAMGEPIIEQLQRDGLPVSAFTTTAQSKPPLIENLALCFERIEWQFLDDPIARGELEAYERKVSQQTGRSSYSAPEGMHDDTVIARALMAHEGVTPAVLGEW